MSTLAKIVVSSLISLMFFSCMDINFGTGVDGNGNVITRERSISEGFDAIKVSRGMDVYITQTGTVGLKVEADENLHDIIKTEVENGVLKIYAMENIRRSSKKAVYLSFDAVNLIEATSGSDLYSESTIKADELRLKTTSGSDMDLSLEANKVYCEATSGSDMQLSGTAIFLSADATSGSDIKAQKLQVQQCDAKASSGADIAVFASNQLYAEASSGGDIRYYGDPKTVKTSDNVSGSVSKE